MLKKIKEILKDETGGPNLETIIGIGTSTIVLIVLYLLRGAISHWFDTANTTMGNYEL